MGDNFKYLKSQPYYDDLYDLLTIKECIREVEFWRKTAKERSNDPKIKGLPIEEKKKGFAYFSNWHLHIVKGENYRRKNETVQKRIEDDRVKQEKYDNAPEPQNVRCPVCKIQMKVKSKILEDYTEKPLRVLFYFMCPKCKESKGIYDNGEERISKPPTCPKCGKEAKITVVEKGKVATWTTKCLSCDYKEIEVDDFDKKEKEWKEKEQKDKELLQNYRNVFCLTEKEGQEYIELMEALEVANVVREEEIQKYQSPSYQYSLQVKRIKIADLEMLLTENFEKAKYTKLTFNNPQIGQYVIVPFTVQDSDSQRIDRVSRSELEKLIDNTLKDTNWRLVSNSLSYRLGFIEGQLKGYEQEEDIIKLFGKKEEKIVKAKVDESKINKYSHHNVVQLARLVGEHIGIENMRKRRLEKEPEGFFLDASKGPYDCGICGEHHYGNEIWWNLDGIRCADCWRNIKEGVIPSLKHRYNNDNSYFQDWQFSDYGLHPSTARKLIRQGVLKGRDLKRKDGSVYCTIFLISDNKEFIKKYPKLPDKRPKVVYVDPVGREIEL